MTRRRDAPPLETTNYAARAWTFVAMFVIAFLVVLWTVGFFT